MKNRILLFSLLILVGMSFPSCTYDSFEEELSLKEIPNSNEAAFVRFDNSVSTVSAAEADLEASVRLEFTFPIETDVTVSYTYSGTAVEGEDFTIEGASGGSGTIVIPHNPDAITINQVDLVVNLIEDGVVDGDKDVTVTLTDAVAADGTPLSIGQAGKFTEVTFQITDSDG
jgi:hypothetical protein